MSDLAADCPDTAGELPERQDGEANRMVLLVSGQRGGVCGCPGGRKLGLASGSGAVRLGEAAGAPFRLSGAWPVN